MTTTPTTTVSTPTQPARLFNPDSFRFTFFRALKSELRKLTASVGFWVTSVIAVLISAAMVTVIAAFTEDSYAATPLDPALVTSGWTFYTLFLIPLAVLAVSSEYAHNTMRTTVLAVPKRTTAFFAKMTAIFIYCGALSAAIIVANIIAVFVFGNYSGFEENSARAFLISWLVMTTLALGSAGIAYLLRSSAFSIIIMIVVLNFLSITTAIPNETIRDFFYVYLPAYVGDAAMAAEVDTVMQRLMGLPDPLSWGPATVLWLAYMAVPVVGGFIRFVKSDV